MSGPHRLVVLLAIGALVACAAANRQGPALSSSGLPTVRLTTPATGKIEPMLSERMSAAGESAALTALVDLSDQLDLDAFAAHLARLGVEKGERRMQVIRALEEVASEQQARLDPTIEEMTRRGAIVYVRPVAVVNRLVVEATPAGLRALADRPEVARILGEWTSERRPSRSAATPTPEGRPLPERFTSWAIEAMGAERVWSEGLTGRGVVVATIDTGVLGEHEQLRDRRLPEARGWFDPVQGSLEPRDPHGHGTSVLSLAVGSNLEGRIVGIAPGARWASALGNWQNFYSRARMTLAADWILREARPDVLVNAWSHDEGSCTDFDLPFVRAWQAAEIFVVFPAGNSGPASFTAETPAALAGAFPLGGPVFSVGALAPSGSVSPSSSRGPSRCRSEGFPSVAAPGDDLPFAFPPNPRGYGSGHGTSLAAGLVGGAAALLLEAVPTASPAEIGQALLAGARDLPPHGPDQATGAGSVDIPAALARLRAAARR